MSVLIGGFLFVFGLIFFLAGGGISLVRDLFSGHLETGLQNMVQLTFGGVGFLFMVVGAILFLTGLARGKKRKALALKIFEVGVPAQATVTFVDKNYGLLVNNKPIYSIVEFKFRDSAGVERVGRKNDVSSDLVIRLKIEVGSKVQVKYMNENPNQNILMLPNPGAGPS
jgi:hypothetical protein